MNTLLSFFIGFLSIAAMITIHELGHFLAARAFGITVEVFAIGWGKPIISWHRNGVSYRINIFPLGGYCKLLGADDLKLAWEENKDDIEKPSVGSLFSVHPLTRIATYIAGPLANILGAFLIAIPFFLIGFHTYTDANKIVVTSDYPTLFGTINPASQAGIQTGDVILSVNGMQTPNFFELQKALSQQQPDISAKLEVLREGELVIFDVIPAKRDDGQGVFFGVAPFIPPIVSAVDPLSVEAASGLAPEDTIISLGEKDIYHALDLTLALQENPQVVVMRVKDPQQSIRTLQFVPNRNQQGEIVLHFSLQREHYIYIQGLSLPKAISSSFTYTFSSFLDIIRSIPTLFTSSQRVSDVVAGPLRISFIIGEMRNSGLRALLQTFVIISISLAVANLLPIPALDGGMIVLGIVELCRKKRISPRWFIRFQTIGVAFLLVIMVLVLAGDITFFLRT